jgi:hypothetical protein
MSGFSFQRATVHQARLRLALIGPAGSGKTYSALNVAQHLGSKVAVIDTERGSASKYAGLFGFDVLELTSFAPQTYVQAIQAADAAGYDVLVIDSLSHAWMGKDGALEMVDRAAKRSQSGNSFGAWRDVTPHHNAMIDAILACRAHVVATLRAKTDYVQERDEKTGRTVIRKVGLAPVQREGLDFEFDVCGDLDQEHNLVITKSRCPALADAVIPKPGKELAEQLRAWLGQGEPPVVQSAQSVNQTPAPAPTPAVQATNGRHPEALVCETCGLELGEIRFRDGTAWLPAQLASLSQRKHGRVLCMDHYREANEARRRQAVATDDSDLALGPGADPNPITGECQACHADSEINSITRFCVDVAGCKKRAGAIKQAPATAPPDDDEPPSAHTDATLAADLDAAFAAQAPAVTVSFGPKDKPAERAAAFSKKVEGQLSLRMKDVTGLLGMSVKEYMADTEHACPTLETLYGYLAGYVHQQRAFPGVALPAGSQVLAGEAE